MPEPATLSGDLNAGPGSNEYAELVTRGWIDSHLAAGNASAVRPTRQNCTGADLTDLDEATAGEPPTPSSPAGRGHYRSASSRTTMATN